MLLSALRSLAPHAAAASQRGGSALAASAAAAAAARPLATAPCVYDYLIRFHVIDNEGKKHTLKGLAGKSIAATMHDSGLFQKFDDFCYGPDQPDPDTHVYVSNEHLDAVGPLSDEELVAIGMCGSEVRANSRMAAYLTLDKTMTDLVLAHAPNQPWATP